MLRKFFKAVPSWVQYGLLALVAGVPPSSRG